MPATFEQTKPRMQAVKIRELTSGRHCDDAFQLVPCCGQSLPSPLLTSDHHESRCEHSSLLCSNREMTHDTPKRVISTGAPLAHTARLALKARLHATIIPLIIPHYFP
jgi:hypothetical protein